MVKTMLIGFVALFLAAAVAAAPARVVARQGHWAALAFDTRCEAAARPLPPSSNREPRARAGFGFDRRRPGEFYAHLSRLPRPGASVMLMVGDRQFLLTGRGAWAWSRGGAQEAAIIGAVRGARSMRISTRDRAGQRFSDRYLLDGAPTAIDAAAADCAGKI